MFRPENSFSIAHGWSGIGLIDLIAIRSLSDPQFENGWAWQDGVDPDWSLHDGTWSDVGNNSLRVMSGSAIDTSIGTAWGGARWSGDFRDVAYDLLMFEEGESDATIAWHIEFTFNSSDDYYWTYYTATWTPTRDQVLQSIPLPPAFLLGLFGLGAVAAAEIFRRKMTA